MCSDVEVEPPLLPLTGEKLPKGSITSPGARLDVSARNLWSPLAKAFIDVRVFKRGENYSSVVSFLRRRFRFDLSKTCVIAMRGYKKSTTTAAKIDTLDLDLRTTASSC